MKFFYCIFAIFLIGSVAAQTEAPVSGIDQALEQRAKTLLDTTKRALEEIRAAGQGHLTSTVEHEVALVEALSLDLSKHTAGTGDHQRHVLEEELLHLENRIWEELDLLRNFNHQARNYSAQALIQQGDMLIQAAKEVLRIEPNVRENKVLTSEIVEIEKLVKDIQAKPMATDLQREEEQLARHEQSLRQILARIHFRNSQQNPNGGPGV